ncbi:hypothetical protein GGR01_003495 [Acetobacter oeni]|nr:hypothetical protein [Acetobacter oeni]
MGVEHAGEADGCKKDRHSPGAAETAGREVDGADITQAALYDGPSPEGLAVAGYGVFAVCAAVDIIGEEARETTARFC